MRDLFWFCFLHRNATDAWTLVVEWLRLPCSQGRGPGVPSLVWKLDPMLQLKSPHAATKDPVSCSEGQTKVHHSQIKNFLMLQMLFFPPNDSRLI